MNSRRTELMAFCALVLAALALAFAVRPAMPSAAETLGQGSLQREPAVSQGSIPITFNYQGTLRLSNGNPANGAYTMTLSIYDSVSSGTLLHQEIAQNVVVRDGLFTVLLGDQAGNPINSQVFVTVTRYLGIAVAPDSEMLPRPTHPPNAMGGQC